MHIKYHRILLVFVIFNSLKESYENNVCEQISSSNSVFDSLAIFVVDAMRADFIPTIQDPNIQPKWKYIEKLAETNGIKFECSAEAPTVTVPRTKAFLTGLNPSFTDFVFNLNAFKLADDNLVWHLHKDSKYKDIYFYGDHTWEDLFSGGNVFKKEDLINSFNLFDIDGDDNRIARDIVNDLNQNSDWNVLIVHWVGIDRIGHSQGLNWKSINRKLSFYDGIAEKVIEHWNKNGKTGLFVLTSDHGMTDYGGHGSGSYSEVTVPLLMLSNRKINHQTILKQTNDFEQIDIVTTLSELLGIKIPQKSQGKLITDALKVFGKDSSSILCSLNRTVNALHNSLNYEYHLKHNKYYEANFQPELMEAYRLHEAFFKNSSKDNEAIEAYNKYLKHIQKAYHTGEQYGFFTEIILIIFFMALFIISLLFLMNDFKNYSILFIFNNSKDKKNKKDDENFLVISTNQNDQTKIKEKEPKNWFNSRVFQFLAILLLILRFSSFGSINFMNYEVLFWNYSAQILILLIIIINLLNYKSGANSSFLSVLYGIFILLIYRYLLTKWYILTPLSAWQKTYDSNYDDIYYKLEQYENIFFRFDHFVFLLSLSFLAVQSVSHIKTGLSRIFVLLYFCVFMFRNYQILNDNLGAFKITIISQNFFSKTVYLGYLILLLIFCLPNRFLKKSKLFRVNKLMIFTQLWILMFSIIIDPKLLPVLALYVLFEALLNRIFITNSLEYTGFFRLISYTVFAYTSFYHVGNSNSLATLNVTACFVGLEDFILIPCVFFTIVHIYSGFIFWMLALFYRFDTNLIKIKHQKSSESRYRDQIQLKSNKYKQKLNIQSALRLCSALFAASFGTETLVIFVMLDHFLLWTTVLPKFLYELSFTVLWSIVCMIVYLCSSSLKADKSFIL